MFKYETDNAPQGCLDQNPIINLEDLSKLDLTNPACWSSGGGGDNSCGKVTVFKGPGYNAYSNGITTPESFDKCYVSFNEEEFDVNGSLWEGCNQKINKKKNGKI